MNYLLLFLVQDDTEAQGSSGSQEKENSEEQMETSTEVCLKLINLKFPRTSTMQQEGGIIVWILTTKTYYYLSDSVLSLWTLSTNVFSQIKLVTLYFGLVLTWVTFYVSQVFHENQC